MDHIDCQKPRAMLCCYIYDLVCIFATFSNLFGMVMSGFVLMEVTRMSTKLPIECQRVLVVIVWWELLVMPVLLQCSNSYATR